MATQSLPSHFFIDAHMEEPVSFSVADGEAVAFAARGPDREGANEDGLLVFPLSDKQVVLVLADGFGGHPSGDEASRLTLKAVESCVRRVLMDGAEVRESILNGFEKANADVRALGVGAASTLSVAEVCDGRVRPYHVGDSEMVVVGQRGKLKFRTIPHSPVGYGVEAGLIDEKEAIHHEERHIVSNMVGAEDMRIDMGARLSLAARDVVLIASDGLWDNVVFERIVETIRKGTLRAAVGYLAQLAYKHMLEPREGRPSKPDDLSIIAFRRKR